MRNGAIVLSSVAWILMMVTSTKDVLGLGRRRYGKKYGQFGLDRCCEVLENRSKPQERTIVHENQLILGECIKKNKLCFF